MSVTSARRRSWFVCVAALVLMGIVIRPEIAVAHDVPEEMSEAAERLLRSLNETQRQQVSLDVDGERRKAWHYFPSSMLESRGGRRGLAIKEMSTEQRLFALGLLNTALSHKGYLQSMTIMALESILRDLENGNPRRDPEMYHVAIYGTPSTTKTWGWSFEGHHLSVNLTLVDGQHFSVTPSFFGSNPAVVRAGPLEGLDTLASEQKLARELVHSFTPEQRKMAVITEKAPRDIITGAAREVSKSQFDPPQGIPFDKLDTKQQAMLLDVMQQFVAKYRPQIIEQINTRTPISETKGIYFAWAGGFEPGEGHYYRIQTSQFVFEYDNTQNNANHIHTVWRQFDGDFGEDLLRHHYETSPHHRH